MHLRLLLLTTLMVTPAAAETLTVHHACTWDGPALSGRVSAAAPADRVQRITRAILSTAGLVTGVEVRAASIANAAALLHGDERYVLYNPRFLDDVSRRAGTPWAAISVLAHEIGHHLGGHTLDDRSSRPHTELEADQFSGFVLARLGASLDEAQAAMRLMGAWRANKSHPAGQARLDAIRDGWELADAPLPPGILPDTSPPDGVGLRAAHLDQFSRGEPQGDGGNRAFPRITRGPVLPPSRRHTLPAAGIRGAAIKK